MSELMVYFVCKQLCYLGSEVNSMKGKKWIMAAGISLVITAAVAFFTEAYLDFGGNIIKLLVGFVFFTLVIRFIVGALPHAKQQLNGEGNFTQTAPMETTIAADPTPKCPKCGSTSISANKKGFGVGKAVIGNAIAGPIGLVAGNIGAKKVRVTCLNCGHHWTRG